MAHPESSSFATAATVAFLLLTGAASAPGQDPAPLFEDAKLTASDGDPGDLFGVAVAVDGDLAAVGATGDDSQGFDSGAAYVYERDADDPDLWNELVKLTGSDGATGDKFGDAVAAGGDTVVVGAPFDDVEATDAGAAYVFQRDAGGAGAWGQVVKLTASDPGPGERFGVAVAIAGDTIAVGAFDAQLGTDAGAVYVFERDAGGTDAWGEVAKLTASDGTGGDYFGVSVAVDGDTLAVGSSQGLPFEPISGPGAAYVFDRDPGDPAAWSEVARLGASDGDFGDLFGLAVDVSGDRVVAGAPAEDEIGLDAGSAFVFERDQGGVDAWGEVKKLFAFDGGVQDSFGFAVAIDGDRLVIGSLLDDQDAANAGSAHIFVRDFNDDGEDLWAQEGKLRASDAGSQFFLGGAVAWSGNVIVVGAQGGEAAYVYDVSFFFEPVPACILFDNFCDRLDLTSDFLEVTGTWQNWDCDGGELPVSGFPLPDNTWRVFCLEPGCPLGNFWAYFLDFDTSTFDLWGAEGGPPAFQVQDDEPFTRIDAPCDEVITEDAGGDRPSFARTWGIR